MDETYRFYLEFVYGELGYDILYLLGIVAKYDGAFWFEDAVGLLEKLLKGKMARISCKIYHLIGAA